MDLENTQEYGYPYSVKRPPGKKLKSAKIMLSGSESSLVDADFGGFFQTEPIVLRKQIRYILYMIQN
jgi:hypothetical protein